MVTHLVRLKLTLLANTFRRSRAQAIGMILGVLYFGGLVVGLAVALAGLRAAPHDAAVVMPLLGAALTLAWAFVPLLAFGVDPTLDPARFATFAVPYRQLAAGLVAAALVSLPAIATSVIALGTVVAWTHGVLATVVAVVAAAIGVLTCVTLSRWLSAVMTGQLTSRRGRDLTAIIALAVVVLVAALFSLVDNVGDQLVALARDAARIAGWTPLGWVWAAPADVVSGRPLVGLLRLVLGAATLAGLGLLWLRAMRREVESPRAVTRVEAVAEAGDLGWFGRMPDTQTGAVAAQVVTYYARDPRYQVAILTTPLVPLLLLVPHYAGDLSWTPLLMAPLAAFVLGWGEHNALAFESTAFWLHVASGTRGRSDRLARLVVNSVLVAALVPAYAVAGAWLAGRWDLLPAVLGLAITLVGAGYGLSCIQSVVLPYPVPKPGESPFTSPPGAAGITIGAQTVASLVTVLLTAPTTVLALLAWLGHGWASWAAGACGLVLGPVLFAVGLRIGSRLYDRRAPELLQSLARA